MPPRKFSLILVKPDPADPQAPPAEFEVEYRKEMDVAELSDIISAIFFANSSGLGITGDAAKRTITVAVWEYFKTADDISGPRKIYPLSQILWYPEDFANKKFTVVEAKCKSKADRLIESWKMFGFEQEFGALAKSKADEALAATDNDIEKAMGWLCKVLDKPTISTMCRIFLRPLCDRWTALVAVTVLALMLPATWVTPEVASNNSPSRSFASCALDLDVNVSANVQAEPKTSPEEDVYFTRGPWGVLLFLTLCSARLYQGVDRKMARVETKKWKKHIASLWWGKSLHISGKYSSRGIGQGVQFVCPPLVD